VVDDPTTRQIKVQERAGAYAGAKKYGEAANLPAAAMKKRGGRSGASPSSRGALSSPSPRSSRGEGWGEGQTRGASPSPTPLQGASRGAASSPSPLAGEGRGGGSTSRAASGRGGATSKIHKPHLDEMHGPESLPHRPSRSLPQKPFGEQSKVFQPTDSHQSGPEFGPAPRSTGGAPGKRGGWKRR